MGSAFNKHSQDKGEHFCSIALFACELLMGCDVNGFEGYGRGVGSGWNGGSYVSDGSGGSGRKGAK